MGCVVNTGSVGIAGMWCMVLQCLSSDHCLVNELLQSRQGYLPCWVLVGFMVAWQSFRCFSTDFWLGPLHEWQIGHCLNLAILGCYNYLLYTLV